MASTVAAKVEKAQSEAVPLDHPMLDKLLELKAESHKLYGQADRLAHKIVSDELGIEIPAQYYFKTPDGALLLIRISVKATVVQKGAESDG